MPTLGSSETSKVEELWNKALDAKLEIPRFVRELNFRQMADAYNGIGPEWFSKPLRKAIDHLSDVLRPMALVHDCEWAYGPDTKEAFYRSNARLRRNGKRLADAKYGRFNPLRYWYRFEATRFSEACRLFGWSAFVEAHWVAEGEI